MLGYTSTKDLFLVEICMVTDVVDNMVSQSEAKYYTVVRKNEKNFQDIFTSNSYKTFDLNLKKDSLFIRKFVPINYDSKLVKYAMLCELVNYHNMQLQSVTEEINSIRSC